MNSSTTNLKGGIDSIPGEISKTCITTEQAKDVKADDVHSPGTQEVISVDRSTLQSILAKLEAFETANREKDKRINSLQQDKARMAAELPYRSLTVGGRNGATPVEGMFSVRTDPIDGTIWVRPPEVAVGSKSKTNIRPAFDSNQNPIMHPDASNPNADEIQGVPPEFLQLCFVDKHIGELRMNSSLDYVSIPNPVTGKTEKHSLRGWFTISVAAPRTYLDIRTKKPGSTPRYIFLDEDVSPEAIAEKIAQRDVADSRNAVSDDSESQTVTETGPKQGSIVNENPQLNNSATPSENLERTQSAKAQAHIEEVRKAQAQDRAARK
jgi:hypothetical protein